MIKEAWIINPIQDTTCAKCKKRFRPKRDSVSYCSFDCAKSGLSESDDRRKKALGKKMSFGHAMRKYRLSHYGDSLPNV